MNWQTKKSTRSPQWVKEVGLEWLYTLLTAPQLLWQRYIINTLPFLRLVLTQRWQLYTQRKHPQRPNHPNR